MACVRHDVHSQMELSIKFFRTVVAMVLEFVYLLWFGRTRRMKGSNVSLQMGIIHVRFITIVLGALELFPFRMYVFVRI